MTFEDDLTQPLWRVLGRVVVRHLGMYALADRWSYLSAAQRDERRAHWPAWRRGVRPVGLGIFWAGVIWSVFGNDHTTTTTLSIRVIWIVLIAPFAYLGVRDWLRDGKVHRSAAGH